MIVKMMFGGTDKNGQETYERMVECDTIHKHEGEDKLNLSLYKDGKLIDDPDFKHSVQVYIMEKGKTVEHINFRLNN